MQYLFIEKKIVISNIKKFNDKPFINPLIIIIIIVQIKISYYNYCFNITTFKRKLIPA